MSSEVIARLVMDAQSGCSAAFSELVIEFESRVTAIVFRRLRNAAETEDVVQEVFLRAFRKLDQLNEPERFAGWICQIAARLSINRATRRPPESAVEPESFDGLRGETDCPGLHALRNEDMEQVRIGLERLGTVDRETLVAFYFEGQSLKEMSDQFQRPVGTIKRRLHTARNRLKDVMVAMQPA